MRPPRTLEASCHKLIARLDYCVEELAFVTPAGVLESVDSRSARAMALMASDRSSGYTVVGVYQRGVSLAQVLADVREALL
jgi:hypothetical protein